MTVEAKKKSCDRCGSCCLHGGPALHTPDKLLIDSHVLGFEDLVTIRRGEMAFQPMAEYPEPVGQEFIKLRGQGAEWSCLFYEPHRKECLIYEHRPMACGLLDCTAPEAILSLAGKDLIDRFTCITAGDPLLPLVSQHESLCPCPDLAEMQRRLADKMERDTALAELTRLANEDMAWRSRAISEYNLPLRRELFYFGRPLFQLLMPFGILVSESAGGLVLHWQGRV